LVRYRVAFEAVELARSRRFFKTLAAQRATVTDFLARPGAALRDLHG
jgi:hypothetical protein